jgi:hypothetical protein
MGRNPVQVSEFQVFEFHVSSEEVQAAVGTIETLKLAT